MKNLFLIFLFFSPLFAKEHIIDRQENFPITSTAYQITPKVNPVTGGIEFSSCPKFFDCENAFVVHLSNVKNKNELLFQLNKKLNFPDYFGFNWDALLDMLCDLHWIDKEKIVLIHDESLDLDSTALQIYLEILLHTIKTWQNFDGPNKHIFRVIFPKETEDSISKML